LTEELQRYLAVDLFLFGKGTLRYHAWSSALAEGWQHATAIIAGASGDGCGLKRYAEPEPG
jgi:hypothetical protein